MGLGDSTVEGKGTPVFGDRNFSQGDPGKPILFPCLFSVGDCFSQSGFNTPNETNF
jgi:hypothetical protein